MHTHIAILTRHVVSNTHEVPEIFMASPTNKKVSNPNMHTNTDRWSNSRIPVTTPPNTTTSYGLAVNILMTFHVRVTQTVTGSVLGCV